VRVQAPALGGQHRDPALLGGEVWASLPLRWLGRSRRRQRAPPSARWAQLEHAGGAGELGQEDRLAGIGWGREVR
jgi:hypothetical protein